MRYMRGRYAAPYKLMQDSSIRSGYNSTRRTLLSQQKLNLLALNVANWVSLLGADGIGSSLVDLLAARVDGSLLAGQLW